MTHCHYWLPHPAAADAQRRFVSKQEAFGTGGTSSGDAAPTWRHRLCDATLLNLPAYQHILPGNCSLTSRKVSEAVALPGLVDSRGGNRHPAAVQEASAAFAPLPLPALPAGLCPLACPTAVPQTHRARRQPPVHRLQQRPTPAGPRGLPELAVRDACVPSINSLLGNDNPILPHTSQTA